MKGVYSYKMRVRVQHFILLDGIPEEARLLPSPPGMRAEAYKT